jgi:hypothetical protein
VLLVLLVLLVRLVLLVLLLAVLLLMLLRLLRAALVLLMLATPLLVVHSSAPRQRQRLRRSRRAHGCQSRRRHRLPRRGPPRQSP